MTYRNRIEALERAMFSDFDLAYALRAYIANRSLPEDAVLAAKVREVGDQLIAQIALMEASVPSAPENTTQPQN